MELEALRSILQSSGVVGAGGAGFPTYMKLNPKAEIVLLNCAECEPLLKLHQQLLETHTAEILRTARPLRPISAKRRLAMTVRRGR